MYRSKRADKAYLLGWLKLAAVVFVLLAVGVVVVFAQNRNGNGDDAVPVAAEYPEAIPVVAGSDFLNTYENGGNPEVSEVVYIEENSDGGAYEEIFEELYECEEIYVFRSAYAIRIPTDEPGVYRAPKIALTFDDGPVWLTEYLLDILDYYGVPATFFVIGELVEEGAHIVRRAFEAGHEIAGHSWNHRDLARLSADEIYAQIVETTAIIEYVIGETPPPFFRVPFGHFNRRIQIAAERAGYGVINWSIDPKDWRYRDECHIYGHIMENARDGAIVVLHDIYPTTIYAMAKVIPSLIYQGFELVTTSEIISFFYPHDEIIPGFEYTGVRR